MPEFNSPFYFALPRGARRHHVSQALGHIAATFGIRGRAEFVRIEPTFALFRVVSA